MIATNHRVNFFEGDIGILQKMARDHPVLLCCQLSRDDAKAVPEYVQAGWIPGTAHSVVYFGSVDSNGRALHVIGDPSQGFEVWTSADLSVLWTGEGLQISHVSEQPIE